MSGLDRIPDNGLSREIEELSLTQRERKSEQERGSSAIRTFRAYTSNSYDLEINPGTGFQMHVMLIEFIPDDKTFGGPFAYRLGIKQVSLTGTPLSGRREPERVRVVDGRQMWKVIYTSQSPATVRLKFYVFATGSGTIQVSIVS